MKYSKKNPIGVFDSGVGGLSVLKELVKVLPKENFEYLGDTNRMPYGVRTEEEVKAFTIECLKFLEKKEVKTVVIACNTATSFGLEAARKVYDFNIIGVVEPACEYSATITKNKKIALIATTGTVSSKVYDRTLKEIDDEIELRSVGAPQLVLDIENGNFNNDVVKNSIIKYLDKLGDYDYDTIILGCTHFPLARAMFEEVLKEKGKDVNIVDSGSSTALRLKECLEKDDLLNDEKKPKINFYATGEVEGFKNVVDEISEFEKNYSGKSLL